MHLTSQDLRNSEINNDSINLYTMLPFSFCMDLMREIMKQDAEKEKSICNSQLICAMYFILLFHNVEIIR